MTSEEAQQTTQGTTTGQAAQADTEESIPEFYESEIHDATAALNRVYTEGERHHAQEIAKNLDLTQGDDVFLLHYQVLTGGPGGGPRHEATEAIALDPKQAEQIKALLENQEKAALVAQYCDDRSMGLIDPDKMPELNKDVKNILEGKEVIIPGENTPLKEELERANVRDSNNDLAEATLTVKISKVGKIETLDSTSI